MSSSSKRFVRTYIVLSTIAVILVAIYYYESATPQNYSPVAIDTWTSEGVLRNAARSTVRPQYPSDAITKNITGTAVAHVFLSVRGDVLRVKILEAPSASISDAVMDATRRWTFEPFPGSKGKPIRSSGKLTFYFVCNNSRYDVLYPSEMPYLDRLSKKYKQVPTKKVK
jgi:TonB family protein